MNRAEIKAFLDGYYRDRIANDAALLLRYVKAGMEYEMAGSPAESPVVATSLGSATVEDIARAMVAAWKWRRVDIRAMLIEDDRAAVHFRLQAEYAPKHEAVEMEVGNFWTFRDGVCAKLVEFADTALMKRLAQ
ncbi:MAG: nuclear transport factor 2 family protein [Parvularculaceae bacterium]|nr:nuclear transport factor 2 family protein [Parvularculaceae bacterium]